MTRTSRKNIYGKKGTLAGGGGGSKILINITVEHGSEPLLNFSNASEIYRDLSRRDFPLNSRENIRDV